VDPSHIRHLRNGYGNAMTEHENVFGNEPERLQKWRSALFEVAGMSGKPYETNNGCVVYFQILLLTLFHNYAVSNPLL
jgi:hypothetical protein